MVNVTVSISEETAKGLRRVVREVYRSRKGTLSSLVEGAIKEALDREEDGREASKLRAIRSGRVVPEAFGLGELSDMLKRGGIDPRRLRVESTTHLNPIVRTGPRASRQ
jgi:hypothetical protein